MGLAQVGNGSLSARRINGWQDEWMPGTTLDLTGEGLPLSLLKYICPLASHSA